MLSGMKEQFDQYQQTKQIEIDSLDQALEWLHFIAQHNLQTDVLFMALMLCEIMLYLSNNKIIQFNLYRRTEFRPAPFYLFMQEYQAVYIADPICEQDLQEFKLRLVEEGFLKVLLQKINYMLVNCDPTWASSYYGSFFSEKSEEQMKIREQINKCAGVIKYLNFQ